MDTRFSTSQQKRTNRSGFLRGFKLRKKEDTIASTSGKQERGAPLSATATWVEGTQRVVKEELVDQSVVDHLKRSERFP